jgi:steroid delta-isomerase-like uncharacterized protein
MFLQIKSPRLNSNQLPKGENFMSAEQNKAVSRRFNELFDQGDMPGMEALVAPNCVAHQPGMPPLDREGFKQVGYVFLSAFADSQTVIEEQAAEDDKVFSRGIWSATHKGAFNGIPATGKRFTISIMVMDRILNGQIVEHWAQPDLLGLLQQLGVIPTPQAG